jgi:hypothetical protein
MTHEQQLAWRAGQLAYAEQFGTSRPSRQAFTVFAREMAEIVQDAAAQWQIYFIDGVHQAALYDHRQGVLAGR